MEGSFGDQAMLPQKVAVIGGKDDQRVLRNALLVQAFAEYARSAASMNEIMP